MDKISGRNFVIRFFCKYFVIDQKPSKMVITPEGRPMGPYPFGLFLVSPGATYGQNITSKAFNHFGYFPRKTKRQLTIHKDHLVLDLLVLESPILQKTTHFYLHLTFIQIISLLIKLISDPNSIFYNYLFVKHSYHEYYHQFFQRPPKKMNKERK